MSLTGRFDLLKYEENRQIEDLNQRNAEFVRKLLNTTYPGSKNNRGLSC